MIVHEAAADDLPSWQGSPHAVAQAHDAIWLQYAALGAAMPAHASAPVVTNPVLRVTHCETQCG